jgi:hypothetical protein
MSKAPVIKQAVANSNKKTDAKKSANISNNKATPEETAPISDETSITQETANKEIVKNLDKMKRINTAEVSVDNFG